ncbi:hypothetical protein ACWCPQ_31595 [Nocardia sp. NPDC001965]
MFTVRGTLMAALVGAAALVGTGAATAAPLPLEAPAAVPAESVATDNCFDVIHPLNQMICMLSSISG